jgi:HAMP domain-containing protein
MRLLVKFNILYVAVLAVGVLVSSLIARNLLLDNAKAEVLDHARLMIDSALAVRGYTSSQISRLLETQMEHEFLPQSVPSYSATEVLASLKKKYPEFYYKEATLNPTNPRDRADGWEVDIVNQFRNADDLKEFIGQRETPAGPALYVARPLRITDGQCLRCHSSVQAAPKTMVTKYGPANGFGWQLNEVIGAQIVSVPLGLALQRADRSFNWFIGSLVTVFAVTGIVLNLMIWWLVVRPITRLSALADRVSQGEMQAPEFKTGSRDEIGVLAESFSRLRASVAQAMKMLDE